MAGCFFAKRNGLVNGGILIPTFHSGITPFNPMNSFSHTGFPAKGVEIIRLSKTAVRLHLGHSSPVLEYLTNAGKPLIGHDGERSDNKPFAELRLWLR